MGGPSSLLLYTGQFRGGLFGGPYLLESMVFCSSHPPPKRTQGTATNPRLIQVSGTRSGQTLFSTALSLQYRHIRAIFTSKQGANTLSAGTSRRLCTATSRLVVYCLFSLFLTLALVPTMTQNWTDVAHAQVRQHFTTSPETTPLNKIVLLKINFWPNFRLILGGFRVENLKAKITNRLLQVRDL